MKHEYLIDLLKQNKTVIVPNLGAFSNNENPHHPYLFNEYLKFNDGMMAKYISDKEGITLESAGNTIDKFTNELKDILAAGKEVVIPGIGTLLKKDGKTILNSPFANVTPEKKETPASIDTTSVPKAEIPKVESPKTEIPKVDPLKVETPKVEIPKVEIPKSETPKTEIPKEETPKVEIPKTELPKTEMPKVETPVSIESAPAPKSETPKKETKKDSNKTEKPKKEKKKSRKLVWIIILLLLLGGGGTAGYIFREEIMKMVGMNEKTAESDNDKKESDKKEESKEKTEEEISDTNETTDTASVETETPIEEPVVEETPVKEETVAEQPKEEIRVVAANTSTPGTYYIIVGCFTFPEHAESMTTKVSAAGLTPTNVGTFGGLIHIAAGSASDLESALQQATSIRGSFPKLWILKR